MKLKGHFICRGRKSVLSKLKVGRIPVSASKFRIKDEYLLPLSTIEPRFLGSPQKDSYKYPLKLRSKGKGQSWAGHEGPEEEERYSSTLSLTLAEDGVGGKRHVPAALPPGKKTGTHFIGSCVDPRAGLEVCGKSRQHRVSIPGTSSL
jgi:hypothetical protein